MTAQSGWRIGTAALSAVLLLAAGLPALAQYSGNSVLGNPAAGSGGTTPTFRPPSRPPSQPAGRFDTPGQRRLNVPGADTNPSMRGTPGNPCPPGTPACGQ